VPTADDFEFRTFRDTRSYQDTPDIRGFGMPDVNFDGQVNNEDLMLIVLAHVQAAQEQDGTTLIHTSETLDRDTSTMIAVATDAETGSTVAGTYNYDTGEVNIHFL
jgi:hypothetical protein